MSDHFIEYDLEARQALEWIAQEATGALPHACEVFDFLDERRNVSTEYWHIEQIREALEKIQELADIVEQNLDALEKAEAA